MEPTLHMIRRGLGFNENRKCGCYDIIHKTLKRPPLALYTVDESYCIIRRRVHKVHVVKYRGDDSESPITLLFVLLFSCARSIPVHRPQLIWVRDDEYLAIRVVSYFKLLGSDV